MPSLVEELKSWCSTFLARIAAFLSEASAGTLQLTGVLGVAAVLYGLYALRPKPGRRPQQRPRQAEASASLTASAASSSTQQQHHAASTTTQQEAAQTSSASSQGLAWRVKSQLTGVKTVTVSAPGVLLEEWSPEELQESATLRADAAAILQEVRRFANVYVIAHVADDMGEATVRGALEAGGLVGPGAGQIAAHRVLCCSTLDGKISIARQLEPGLHIDGHPHTIESLRRFMPQLLYIRQPGLQKIPAASPNTAVANSLAEIFSAR
ncbi:hypothetical protein CVIRNUC_010795 [Coccomyxa viridis]|uniref:Uncharacterized protein n=1 Tax=Coccomyxa viridis TaxID=1274662 RepID=A0AAV1INE7_9CHLO|nr:hypothetical protein CVIRNUC_010795 [Coccomyxa viridis]